MTNPRYDHDCDQCIFLGHKDGCDMYICPAQPDGVNVVARYGTAGEYDSFPVKVLPSNEPNFILCKIAKVAYEQGHIELNMLPDDMRIEELEKELAYYHAVEEHIGRFGPYSLSD